MKCVRKTVRRYVHSRTRGQSRARSVQTRVES